MKSMLLPTLALLLASAVVDAASIQAIEARDATATKIQPQVFIISMFSLEQDIWRGTKEFNVFERNITIPGLSPSYPNIHCTKDGKVCQITTQEGEIHAAATITSLILSSTFDLTKTYFLIAGIAGVNPKVATIGSVTFARFAVQVALQYEFDARDKPAGFPSGYVPQGSKTPNEFPQLLYGTEVFEVNDALRQRAVAFAKKATLADSPQAKLTRSRYAKTPAYAAGAAPPSVVQCDTATSDNFWSGRFLAEAFENTTKLFTTGQATYCSTQQEDNATLEALLRGAAPGLKRLDFGRIIILRTLSNFDRPAEGLTAADNLFNGSTSGGFEISITNIQRAGVKVVQGILTGWNSTFEKGVKPTNYVGDILGTLGGKPGFLPPPKPV